MSRGSTPGLLGWVGLVAYVWFWDWYGPETLSQVWWRGLAHRSTRLGLIVVWGWVTSHLFFKRPARILVYW